MHKISPNEIKTTLAITLLNVDGYVTIAELSEIILMSKNTLLNDIDDLKLWFL